MAQTPPMQKPTSMRAASSQPIDGARAQARLAIANKPRRPLRMRRRSTPPEATRTTGAKTPANNAGREMARLATPMELPSDAAMGVMRPTGSISVVTTAKVDRPMATTGTHLGASVSMRILSVVPDDIVASPFCGCGDMAGLSGAINRLLIYGLGTKWTQ